VAFDPAPQVFWKDEGLPTALASYQCAISDGLIDCGSSSSGSRTGFGNVVGKGKVHFYLTVNGRGGPGDRVRVFAAYGENKNQKFERIKPKNFRSGKLLSDNQVLIFALRFHAVEMS
jgi:hypothetical protein